MVNLNKDTDTETMVSEKRNVAESRADGAWPEDRNYCGFSNAELESLADPSVRNKGKAPWVHWTSELYSFGRLYREWAFYPKCLPLFVYSDHGIHKKAEFATHEKSNDAIFHFTFIKERVSANSRLKNKKIVHVPHPWIIYRRKKKITQNETAKGTLVFFAHATNVTGFEGHDSESYFEELKRLPEKYQPVVLCLHMADIKKGHHINLRKHGIPIVTAGKTSQVDFVDRFYDLVRNFRFACSNAPGSQMYYCAEMGVPYFLMGEPPKFVNYSNPDYPVGEIVAVDPVQKDLIDIEQDIFYRKLDCVSLQQKIYVEWILGLNSSTTRLDAALILWGEFFRNWKRWGMMVKPTVAWLLRKLALLEIAKKLMSASGKK